MPNSISINKALNLWNRYWFENQSSERLKAYRFVIFALGAGYLFFFPEVSAESFYAHWSPISFYQTLSGPINFGIIESLRYVWIVFSILAGLNILFSFTGKAAAFLGLFYFGYSYNFGHVYHGTHLYVMIALILSFSKVDKRGASPLHRWPLSFCFAYIVYVMTYCGWQKLYYGDGYHWFFSESFYLLLLQNPSSPKLNQWIVNSPLWVSQMTAFFGVIVAEAFLPLFIFHRYLRWCLFFLLFGFHIMVTLTLGGHHTFFSQVFCFSIFLPIENGYSFLKKSIYGLEV